MFSGMARQLNFDDKDGAKVVRNAFDFSYEMQEQRNYQFQSDYLAYRSFVDMTDKDPSRAHLYVPKTWALVETKAPKILKSIFAVHPWVPIVTNRKDYQDVAGVHEEILDHLLADGDFRVHASQAIKATIGFGTSFFEVTPYYKTDYEEVVQPVVVQGQLVDFYVQRQPVQRFCLKFKAYAPWEVYVDPFATNLESLDGCRYVIKFQMVSKRSILALMQEGVYNQIDPKELDGARYYSQYKNPTFEYGYRMLDRMGLIEPHVDSDMGLLMRYESPERYIDVWNGHAVLRDVPNPFLHGGINLNRIIHVQDINAQNPFWGIGEIQVVNVLQNLLNSLTTMTVNKHNLISQPQIFIDKSAVDGDLRGMKWNQGGRHQVKLDGRSIDQVIKVTSGEQLPADHYMLPQTTERWMDVASGQYQNDRGERMAGDATATEVATVKQASSERTEAAVNMIESTFMAPFAKICMSHIKQFMRFQDAANMVGAERAILWTMSNPMDMPSVFNFGFKGSDRVADQAVRHQKLTQAVQLLAANPTVRQDWLATKYLEELAIFNSQEINDGVITLEEMGMMMAAQLGANGVVPAGETKMSNTGTQLGMNARAMRGDERKQ